MKKYLVGFIVGVGLMSGITYADDIKTSVMNCHIIFNGQENLIKDPVINYNGRTYIPLRTFGQLTDAKVEWNSTSNTIWFYEKVIQAKEVIKEVVKEVPVTKTEYKYIEVPKEKIVCVTPTPIPVPVEKFILISQQLNRDTYQSTIKGTVKNVTNKQLKFKVKAYLKDSAGNVIYTKEDDSLLGNYIDPQDIENFSISMYSSNVELKNVVGYDLQIFEW